MNRTRESVLDALRRTRDFVSGQRLCEALGVSRAAVSGHVRELRKLGYDIESIPRRGHRLVATIDLPLGAEVRPHLKTRQIGRHYIFKSELPSSNSFLMDLPLPECIDGMVVVADKQTAGRGRMQRTWFAPPAANLYFSVLLQPNRPISEIPQLALLSALSIVTTLNSVTPDVEVEIKWPNDVLVGGRKLAGILCEMQAETDIVHKVILGMGINVNVLSRQFPPELRETATSLLIETGSPFHRPTLLAEVLNALEHNYEQWLRKGLSPFLPALKKHLLLVGARISVTGQGGSMSGVVEGLSEDGGLILRRGTKQHIVYSGEIQR